MSYRTIKEPEETGSVSLSDAIAAVEALGPSKPTQQVRGHHRLRAPARSTFRSGRGFHRYRSGKAAARRSSTQAGKRRQP
jgi:hypothetical protein